jgi:hypothetical protein
MRVKLSVDTGLVGCTQTSVVEVPDEQLEGLAEAERAKVLDGYATDFAHDILDIWWEETKEEDLDL